MFLVHASAPFVLGERLQEDHLSGCSQLIQVLDSAVVELRTQMRTSMLNNETFLLGNVLGGM